MKNLKFVFDFRNKKVLLWWIVLVGSLIFLGIIYFFYLVYHKDKPVFVPEETRKDVRGSIEENVAQPLAKVWPKLGKALLDASFNNQSNVINSQSDNSNVIDPTANWQTYESRDLGISFKYPQGWILQLGSNKNLRIFEERYTDIKSEHPQLYLEIFENNNIEDLNSWISANKQVFIGDQEESEVSGFLIRNFKQVGSKKIIYFDWESMGENRAYVWSEKSKVFVLTVYPAPDDYLEKAEKIVFSFGP